MKINILLLLILITFSSNILPKELKVGEKKVNRDVAIKFMDDEEGFFDEWKGKVFEDDLFYKHCGEQVGMGVAKNVCNSFILNKRRKLLNVVWPAKTKFYVNDHTICSSKDVKIKDYWAKGSADHKYEVVIYEKDWSTFHIVLAKDTPMVIDNVKKVCPAGSQFSFEYGKPAICCVGRMCEKDRGDWGSRGFLGYDIFFLENVFSHEELKQLVLQVLNEKLPAKKKQEIFGKIKTSIEKAREFMKRLVASYKMIKDATMELPSGKGDKIRADDGAWIKDLVEKGVLPDGQRVLESCKEECKSIIWKDVK